MRDISKNVVIGDADYLAQKKHIKQEFHWHDSNPQSKVRITASGIDIVENSIDKALEDAKNIADKPEIKTQLVEITKEAGPKSRAKKAYDFFFKDHPEFTTFAVEVAKIIFGLK